MRVTETLSHKEETSLTQRRRNLSHTKKKKKKKKKPETRHNLWHKEKIIAAPEGP
jgi:hypothetical protein